jgi:putative hydrolase of the HAD superfamily
VHKPLDAIFFDIDDTLFSTTVFADKARRAAVDAMIRAGLRTDRNTALRELEEVLAEFTSNYGNHFDKVIDRLPAEAGQGVNKAVIVAAGVVAYHDTKWRELQVHDDVYEVLKWLAGTQLIRGIISAGITIKQAEKLVRLQLVEFVTPSAVFFTDQIGFSKANPKLYRRILQRLRRGGHGSGENTSRDHGSSGLAVRRLACHVILIGSAAVRLTYWSSARRGCF